MSGKGSKPRPLSVSRKQFDDNWERIFGKKPKEKLGGKLGATNEKVIDSRTRRSNASTGI